MRPRRRSCGYAVTVRRGEALPRPFLCAGAARGGRRNASPLRKVLWAAYVGAGFKPAPTVPRIVARMALAPSGDAAPHALMRATPLLFVGARHCLGLFVRGRGSRRAMQCVAPTEGSLGGLCRGGFQTRPLRPTQDNYVIRGL